MFAAVAAIRRYPMASSAFFVEISWSTLRKITQPMFVFPGRPAPRLWLCLALLSTPASGFVSGRERSMSFWKSLGAVLITVIVGWITLLIGRKYGLSSITGRYVTGIAFILVLSIGAWLYSALAESSDRRATIGKRIDRTSGCDFLRREVVVRTGDCPSLHEIPFAFHRCGRIHDGRLDQAPPGAPRHTLRLPRNPGRRTVLVPVRTTAVGAFVPPRSTGVISISDVPIGRSSPQMAGRSRGSSPLGGHGLLSHRQTKGEAQAAQYSANSLVSTFSKPARGSPSPSPRADARFTQFVLPTPCSSSRADMPT